MSDLVVRDHSQPCEHGIEGVHSLSGVPHFVGSEGSAAVCPGGREITLREYPDVLGKTVYVVVDE